MQSLDMHVALWVAAHRTDALTQLAMSVMNGGRHPLVLLICATAFGFYVILRRDAALATGVVLSAIVSTSATLMLKSLIERPRPPAGLALVDAAGYSMPSTNAALLVSVTTTALLMSEPSRGRVAWAAVALPTNVFVAACMVYLGAHWVFDIIAGWGVGILCSLVVIHLILPVALSGMAGGIGAARRKPL